MAPGTSQKVSQIDGVRPSSAIAPSIWYDEVATPQRKSAGRPAIRSAAAPETDVVLICLRLSRTCGRRSADRNPAGEPAGDRPAGVVAGRGDPEQRDLVGATVERVRTARVERAAGRHPAQVGR